ncbi:GtrA family protein [Natrinema sp. CGMCC1.2065]|uniref:GtrA family protein n=1 Tax=Natrinema sp. CGMCC1.2065 TaxID=3445767 RepID=UPI003F49D3B5
MSYQDIPIRRFVQFCFVGLSGVFVNVSLLYVAIEIAGIHYLLSSAIAIEISIISNFLLNEIWTFEEKVTEDENRLRRMVKFNLAYTGGMAINIAVLGVLTEYAGVYYMLANLAGIGLATFWNYGFSERFVWSSGT